MELVSDPIEESWGDEAVALTPPAHWDWELREALRKDPNIRASLASSSARFLL